MAAKKELTDLQIAIVVSHLMRRFMTNFKPHERTTAIEKVMMRLTKFLKQRERTNFKDFVYATEFERVIWENATESYDKSTPIFGINFVASLYEYFDTILNRYVKLSPKIMIRFSMVHNETGVSDDECMEIEGNDSDLLSTFIKLFEPYSDVGIRISPMAGMKLTIKNNLIIEGKKLAKGF